MGNNLRRVITYLVCFSLVVASIGVFGVAESSKKAEAATSFTDLNQEAIVEAMGAGWNLGNQFEATDGSGNPSETAWGNPVVTENLIKLVKNAGFKTIRIPVSYLNKISYDSSSDTYVIDSAWLNRIQEVVDLCVKNDLYTIINMHGDGYTTVTGSWLLCNSSDQTTIKKKYADCWKQIANKFADYDEHLIFESMNEEFDGTYGWPNSTYYSNINAYNQIFVDTVRNTGSNNAKRWLLIPGWNTNIEYTTGSYGFELPTDNYLDSSISGNRIMISVHYYDPWDFAGEGSVTQWGKNATGTVSSWGQEDWMSSQFDLLYNKFVSNGYPVVIGEYGATNASAFDSENLSCRKYYYEYLCQQAYAKGCVPVAWDNNGHSTQYRADQFGLFDRWTLAVTSNGQEIIDSIMAVYNAADNCTSTGLSLNKTSLTLKIGETETLVASLTPSTSTDTITWVSSDPTVATVIDGLVTPVKAGTCTVTAKTANGNTATCSVTIEEADIVKLQLFLMNSSSWTSVSSETVEVPSTGGTYTLSVTDTQADLQKIASFYMHDINADLSDTSEDKSSACDYLSFKITSFTVNGTECQIISGYDTFTYDTSLTSEDAHNKKSIDFDFINGWNEERQSILENVYKVSDYAYTFNNISLNSDSNEIAITFEITGAESSEEDTTDQDAADAVEALIDAIGTVEYTDECLTLIETAEDAYDALTATQKALVTNYDVLTTARDTYDGLKAEAIAAAEKAAADQAAAIVVVDLIDAIGTVEYTDDSLALIEAAEDAYNVLTDDQKALVTNYDVLTTARDTYDGLKAEAIAAAEKAAADQAAADEVEELIDAIGTVEYTDASLEKIETAEDAYDVLTDDQKDLVTNYDELENARSEYNDLEAEAIAAAEKAAADQEAAIVVVDLIDAIGTVEYTDECLALIETAEDAYDALTYDQKDLVTNYDELENARSEYNDLEAEAIAAAEKALADQDAASVIVDFIDAIGTVEYTDDSLALIEAAEYAYDALTNDQKDLVYNYEILTTARATYDALKKAAEEAAAKAAADQAAADSVEELIDAIGTVEYTDASLEKIETAEDAYNALTDDQKAIVTNYDVLTTARDTYDGLEAEAIAAAAKAAADQEAASAVVNLIDAIGTVEYTDECLALIETAEDAYDALTDDQKALVTNYDELENARSEYNDLEAEAIAAAEKAAADQAAADAVIELINAIGTVEYTDASLEKIETAEDAYDVLTDDQKDLVTNYDELENARSEYNDLEAEAIAAAEKAAADQAAADEVEALIDAIGTVEYTDDSLALIEAAEDAYDVLTDDQKDLVYNYEILTTARATYDALKKAAEEAAADQAAADSVEELIDAIGTVEYSNTCYNAITNADNAYDALTDDQKVLVTNYDVLTAAKTEYDRLKTEAEEAEKTEQDKQAANVVIELIDAIGTVEYTDASLEKIETAEDAYDTLTAAQKTLVTNYDTLTNARATYDALKKVAEEATAKAAADQEAADAVEALIDAIGTVEYTDDSLALIEAAEDAYDALTDDQKALVTNYDVLTTARDTYDGLKAEAIAAAAKAAADQEAADSVEELIDAIGTVEYSNTCYNAITNADNAYDALTDDQKVLVTNYDVLTAAKTEYDRLKTEAEEAEKTEQDKQAANAVIELINAIGTVEYTDASLEKIETAEDAYDTLTAAQKTLVTNYDTLTNARATYDTLKKAAEAAAAAAAKAADQEAASAVVNLINAIGTVEYTDASLEKIETAEDAYDVLTDDQKELVSNYDDLVAARREYDALKKAADDAAAEAAAKAAEEEAAAKAAEEEAAAKAAAEAAAKAAAEAVAKAAEEEAAAKAAAEAAAKAAEEAAKAAEEEAAAKAAAKAAEEEAAAKAAAEVAKATEAPTATSTGDSVVSVTDDDPSALKSDTDNEATAAPTIEPTEAPTTAPSTATAVSSSATSTVSTSNDEEDEVAIKINLKNNKKYKVNKKVKIKAIYGLKKVKLNNKKIKVKAGKKALSFKLKKYKKFLKKGKKKNKIVVVDKKGNKKVVKFKVN